MEGGREGGREGKKGVIQRGDLKKEFVSALMRSHHAPAKPQHGRRPCCLPYAICIGKIH
jgi:hypothetical protein